MSNIVSIAHRGASGHGHSPENTLAAFREAVKLGVDCVECDVHCTKDGQVVIIHDSSLNRTTDKKGEVKDIILDEVKQADAGSWFAPEFAGERIPTLKELLEFTKGKVLTVIEIKPENITDKVIREVENAAAESEVIIQSFHPKAVKDSLMLNPKIPRALLMSGKTPVSKYSNVLEHIHKAFEIGASTLNLHYKIITPELIRESHKRGISVWAWTVDEEAEMKELADMGVDGITSNYPERLQSARNV